jgi:nucleotide-binding universal stress UspA family protein
MPSPVHPSNELPTGASSSRSRATTSPRPASALAAELAPEAGASITAVFVIEVAAELPLDAHMHDEEHAAREALEKAHAIAASRGVRLRERIVRARSRGEAIVAEAEAVQADLVVMRAAPKNGKRLFGRTGRLRAAGMRTAACSSPPRGRERRARSRAPAGRGAVPRPHEAPG